MRASADAAWQEALSLLVSKMTPQNGEALSRLVRFQSGNSSSSDEEAEATALLEATVTAMEEVPVDLPVAIVNATENVPVDLPTATVNATENVPVDLPTATVNATETVPVDLPTATVNATENVLVELPPLLPIPEMPKDHTRVWADSAFGLELFGLQCSTVRRLIEGLPNAERAKVCCCVIYIY